MTNDEREKLIEAMAVAWCCDKECERDPLVAASKPCAKRMFMHEARCALAVAEPAIRADERKRCARVAAKRANGFHHENCERGHYEHDTGEFVCSNRAGCLCDERTEEAEAIVLAIRSQPEPRT